MAGIHVKTLSGKGGGITIDSVDYSKMSPQPATGKADITTGIAKITVYTNKNQYTVKYIIYTGMDSIFKEFDGGEGGGQSYGYYLTINDKKITFYYQGGAGRPVDQKFEYVIVPFNITI